MRCLLRPTGRMRGERPQLACIRPGCTKHCFTHLPPERIHWVNCEHPALLAPGEIVAGVAQLAQRLGLLRKQRCQRCQMRRQLWNLRYSVAMPVWLWHAGQWLLATRLLRRVTHSAVLRWLGNQSAKWWTAGETASSQEPAAQSSASSGIAPMPVLPLLSITSTAASAAAPTASQALAKRRELLSRLAAEQPHLSALAHDISTVQSNDSTRLLPQLAKLALLDLCITPAATLSPSQQTIRQSHHS